MDRSARMKVVERLVGDGDESVYMRLMKHKASANASLKPKPEVNAIFSSLVEILQSGPHSAAEIIVADVRLVERADAIAKAANEGEHHLERYYAALILLQKQPPQPLPHTPVDRVVRLATASQPFPYVQNYVKLVRAECDVLMACLSGDLSSVAIVGSGPVPLTGAMMAAHLGIRVILIDKDRGATSDANKLIQHWEHRGALPHGAMHAVQQDAYTVDFTRAKHDEAIRADCVLVASLVPDEAKLALARRAANSGWDGVLAVRSAHGLTALANYQTASRQDLESAFDHVGYAVPEGCVEEGRVFGERMPPMAVFPRDVLNSLDVYMPKSLGGRTAQHAREQVIHRCPQVAATPKHCREEITTVSPSTDGADVIGEITV